MSPIAAARPSARAARGLGGARLRAGQGSAGRWAESDFSASPPECGEAVRKGSAMTVKIIVGYDRSTDAEVAARWALDEAARIGAPVEFFYSYDWPVWAPAASMALSP